MALDPNALGELLCKRLCEEVKVEVRPDGALMVKTHFEFPDGDSFPLHLSEAASGGLRLSDQGHTLMHISYEHDIDSFMDGTRGALLEQVMDEAGLDWDGGAFCLNTAHEQLPEAIFNFGQALTRVYDLTLLSRAHVSSTFYDDLTEFLFRWVDEAKVHRDHQPNVPNAEMYPVDYMIENGSGVPLFLYGIPNRDKARLTTIMLGYFRRHGVEFESLLVFADQPAIPRKDLARLSDVGGEMISSLESQEDFRRKLEQRMAA